MSENFSTSKLNPKIKEVEIGIRSLRKIKIYPIAVYDEAEMTVVINEILAFVQPDANGNRPNDIELGGKVGDLLRENLGKLMTMATGEDGIELVKDMDNDQFLDVVEILYDVNFAGSIKKAAGLFEKIRPALTGGKKASAKE